ncbi:MAG: CheR family methyltransferase [Parvularcula sp.]|nr:CheR family methyltransferase [Parvularcula sp.]
MDGNERTHFAEAMVTHTTSFFREAPQFDWLLAEELPRLARERPGRRISIWSAACSTGQEGYTALIAARMAEISLGVSLDTALIGTDLSRTALQQAARAIYTAQQTESIPAAIRSEVLLSSREGPDRIRIVPELRRRATWRRANLATAEGLDGIKADIAFLRNVLIYFDAEVRGSVLDKVCNNLEPGAVLFVGHTEAAQVRHPGLTAIRPSILRWAP